MKHTSNFLSGEGVGMLVMLQLGGSYHGCLI